MGDEAMTRVEKFLSRAQTETIYASERAVESSAVLPREEYAYNKGWQDAIRFIRELETKHLGRETED